MNTPTAPLGRISCSRLAPGGTSQTDPTRRVVSSTESGNASTPTPHTGLENLPTSIPNPEARAIITNPLRTRPTERNQWQRQWQLKLEAVSTPRSVVFGSRSIHRYDHSDKQRHLFATGRLLELHMWNRSPFMSASDLEIVSDVMRHVANTLAEGPPRQIIEIYWNTAMRHNNIWSIAFKAGTKEILKKVCWGNGPVRYYTLKLVPGSSTLCYDQIPSYSLDNGQHRRGLWSPLLCIRPRAFGIHWFRSGRQ